MNNILIKSFFVLFFLNFGFGQLSSKHWIPPLHCRDASSVEDHYLYISTQETTPFQITIRDGAGNSIDVGTYTISNATPVTINLGSGQNTKMFVGQENVNIVLSDKGIILEGTKDFYVSFRVRSLNHSEMLVSKGRPGIGTSFRLGHIINESFDPRKSFVTSVMATEDNTSVTFSDYDPNVVFITSSGFINTASQNFILNAGQSIIFSGYSDTFENLDGAIGALITSDKPVVVNSGNALGGIVNNSADFALDQIVSSSQIGNEYIFIEGNGLASMELPLIVANEDNTEIFINGSATPNAIINAGDYYLVDNSFYQGTTNRNIYVRTSKNVYAYQLLGGGNNTATAGLNFIPPLSCFFQNAVNIPNVDVIGGTRYTADLMVLTYASATVTLNGATISSSQAQAVLGNTDWVTYRISGVSGNVNIQSTGPLAVGVFGYGVNPNNPNQGITSGFAGYYSGFGSNPENTDVAVCSNASVNLFEAIIGNPGENGNWTVPTGGAPLNGNIFDPSVNIAGEYVYTFVKDCNTSSITIPITVTVSIQQAGNPGSDRSISTCANQASFDLFPLLGPGAELGGFWSPALASGTGVFDPAVDVSGIYNYTIPTVGACVSVSAAITVTNNPIPTLLTISDFELCDDTVNGSDTDGFSFFDLTTKNNEISNLQTGVVVTYHLTSSDAINNLNAITSLNSESRVMHTRITNSATGCYNTSSFNLVVYVKPSVNPIVNLRQCDTDSDAITNFNLTQANILIATDNTLTFTYHNSFSGAENNNDFVANEISYTASNGSTIWARITNTSGCFRTSRVNLLVSATTINQNYRYTIRECDDYLSPTDTDTDVVDYFNLTEIEPLLTNQFPLGQSYTYTYYFNQSDAESEQNEITDSTNFRNTIANFQTIWVRIESNLFDCAGLGPYLELIVNPLPDTDLGNNPTVICVDPISGTGSQTIDATPTTAGNYSYNWTPINPDGNIATYTITTPGTYSVIVTNLDTSCSFTDTVTAVISSAPESIVTNLLTPAFATELSTIETIASGGFGTYEYSINTIDWQSSPIFSNLENGSYTVYVRDILGCGMLVSEEIRTISYPSFFTPNNDGYNDYWNINVPNEYQGLISIFDRYGKLLKQISSQGEGWDGIFNGNLLPSTDYWFKIEYYENNMKKEFKSHFSLKR